MTIHIFGMLYVSATTCVALRTALWYHNSGAMTCSGAISCSSTTHYSGIITQAQWPVLVQYPTLVPEPILVGAVPQHGAIPRYAPYSGATSMVLVTLSQYLFSLISNIISLLQSIHCRWQCHCPHVKRMKPCADEVLSQMGVHIPEPTNSAFQ